MISVQSARKHPDIRLFRQIDTPVSSVVHSGKSTPRSPLVGREGGGISIQLGLGAGDLGSVGSAVGGPVFVFLRVLGVGVLLRGMG